MSNLSSSSLLAPTLDRDKLVELAPGEALAVDIRLTAEQVELWGLFETHRARFEGEYERTLKEEFGPAVKFLWMASQQGLRLSLIAHLEQGRKSVTANVSRLCRSLKTATRGVVKEVLGSAPLLTAKMTLELFTKDRAVFASIIIPTLRFFGFKEISRMVSLLKGWFGGRLAPSVDTHFIGIVNLSDAWASTSAAPRIGTFEYFFEARSGVTRSMACALTPVTRRPLEEALEGVDFRTFTAYAPVGYSLDEPVLPPFTRRAFAQMEAA